MRAYLGEPDVEAATEAMTAKLKEHPIPAPNYGGTAEPAMYWGVSVGEVAEVAVAAALSGMTVIELTERQRSVLGQDDNGHPNGEDYVESRWVSDWREVEG